MCKIVAYIYSAISEAWSMVDKTDICFISYLHWPVDLNPKWFDPEDPES